MARPKGTARIYYGKGLYWKVKTTDAKKAVVLSSSVADALAGKAGVTVGCHLSNCATRNSKAFPHKCLFASFTKTKALVVDKVSGGKPTHAWRYAHKMGKLVELNDKDREKKYVRDHPQLVERQFVLSRPQNYAPRPNSIRPDASKAVGPRTGQNHPKVPRGALKRAVDAGFVTADLSLAA